MRISEVIRNTKESQIRVRVDLDGTGEVRFSTGLPFLEHMLEQVARHGLINLEVEAKGDLHIDAHHTVEDIGISLGQAFAKAVGDKAGVVRYGHSYVPLDEALSRVWSISPVGRGLNITCSSRARLSGNSTST